MSEMRTQSQPEKPQQELRFTARDLVLDEALAGLERDGERRSDYLPKNLFLFAMKRISIDLSDTFDGYSQNMSVFGQYRESVQKLSNRGQKTFQLEPWMKELYAGGPGGTLRGIGLRVRLTPNDIPTLLAPPLYGPSHYRSPLTPQQVMEQESARKTLELAREGGFIPVRYEIRSTVDDPTEALERLRGVVELGAWVSNLTIVPTYPRSARQAVIFNDPMPERTYDRVTAKFNEELLPTLTQPIDLRPGDDPEIKNAS